MDPLQMKIKWEYTKKGAQHTMSGVTKLFKLDILQDDDEDLPITHYVGLSRHEFFDALLCVAQHSGNQRPLYLLFSELVINRVLYIYQNMVDLRQYLKGKVIEHQIRDRIQADCALVRIFHKYASLQIEEPNMEEDEWCALAEDLFLTAAAMDHDIWKYGGKPTVTRCFTLSKPADSMHEEWIDLSEFHRCLIYFTAALFRKQPDAKYEVLSFEEKLNLVLKWCHKLDAQTGRSGSVEFFRSDSLKLTKRRRGHSTSISSSRSPNSPFSASFDSHLYGE